MKFITSILLIIGFTSNCKSQIIEVLVLNTFNSVDTLYLGFQDDATMGIDTQLGELDLFGEPTDSLEARIIQRDEANFECSYYYVFDDEDVLIDTVPIYQEPVFDSKINIRNYPVTEENRYFVIRTYGDFSPISIIIRQLDFPSPVTDVIDQITMEFDTCHSFPFVSGFTTPQTATNEIIIFGAEDQTHLTIRFRDDLVNTASEQLAETDQLMLYPNPASNLLYIRSQEKMQFTHFSIYDYLGKRLQQDLFKAQPIDITGLANGMYILHLLDSQTGQLLVRKFNVSR